jgi:2-oxoglutarate dehydrogenase E2 component (dihydrolipoamide succinyltransferase)
MSVEIRVPQLPESVADATLVAWRKQPGEAVSRDENLADLETDKVVLEVPSPVAGVVRELRAANGSTVKSGDLLALIDASAGTADSKGASASNKTTVSAAAAVTPAAADAQPKLGPAARRVAEEQHLAATTVSAAARDGRVSKADLLAAAASAPATPAPAPLSAKATPPVATRTGRAEQRVPMTRLRQKIAERLVQAQSNAALLTSFNEVDLTAVLELRSRYKDGFEKKHGVKLGLMSFFVTAAIEGLKKFPVINAAVDGNEIVYHEYYDIGIAVSTERGLIVPVLRDADQLGFAGIEKGIAAFAQRAREGTISLEDLTGGTFSITNGGVFGSLMSTPIVNAPQSAILGMHKTQERPMVVNGQVVPRPMMYVAVTYDHRIIDGREAVQFLVTVKDCLEDPGRMLLGV